MDRPNSCLIQFDTILLDVNENPSDVENAISDGMEPRESSTENDKTSENFSISVGKGVFSPSILPKVSENTDLSDCLLNAGAVSNSDMGIHESKTDVMDGDNYSVNSILGSSQNNEQVSSDTGKFFDITSCNLNLSNGFGGFISELNNEDAVPSSNESFHDAVQFFNDPSSFTFLENAGGPSAEPFNPRSSLFMNFDPLHANFNSQFNKKTSVLEEISESESHVEISGGTSKHNNPQPFINENVADDEASHKQSLGIDENLTAVEAFPNQSLGFNPKLTDVELSPKPSLRIYENLANVEASPKQSLGIRENLANVEASSKQSLGICENLTNVEASPKQSLGIHENLADVEASPKQPLGICENLADVKASPKQSLGIHENLADVKDSLKQSLESDKNLTDVEASPKQSLGSDKNLTDVEASAQLYPGNILISFDSPAVSQKNCDNITSLENENPKIYTEVDLQQALKLQELSFQEHFLKKQREMENKITKQNILYSSLDETLKDVVEIAFTLSEKEKNQQESIEQLVKENAKLKEDLKTSVEDLQSVENIFADFHKRYEQCKSMLKVYAQNETGLKQQIEKLTNQLQEKEEMYNALQVRTQEMVDKANLEVANVKKAGDAQAAVLKAQLKKAELKISSLESDVKHVKIENGKLSSICDDLMAKVGES